MRLRSLTVKDRILLHLFDYARHSEEYDVPLEVTQTGIASAVGIRVQHVTQYVRPLLSEDVVSERTSHIQRKPRRRKVYFLTAKGRRMVASLRGTLGNELVPYRTLKGKVEEIPLSRLYQEERRGTSLLQLASELDSSGFIEEEVELTSPELVDFSEEAPSVEQFYGREAELEELLDSLKRVPMVVVTGMAGIGKSTLGAQSAKVLRSETSIFWLRVRPWDTALYLALQVGRFLKAQGRLGLHSYLSGAGSKELSRCEEFLLADLRGIDALLILDDVHNASEDAKALFPVLLNALKQAEGVSALLLSRAAPDFYGRREVTLEGTVVELSLGGLGAEEGRALLLESGVPEAQIDRFFRNSGGNPLFLRILAKVGTTGGPEAGWTTLETYIGEAIEPSLAEEELRCLQLASFYEVPVAPPGLLLGGGASTRTLVGLQKKGLLISLGAGNLILHDSLRAHFQRGLSPEGRQEFTATIVPWTLREADRTADAGDTHDAIALLENAALIEGSGPGGPNIAERLGTLYSHVGNYPRAVEVCQSALEETKDPPARAGLQQLIGHGLTRLGLLEEAEEAITAGLQELPSEPSLEAGWLLYRQAEIAQLRQDFSAAWEDLERVASWMSNPSEDLRLWGRLANLRAIVVSALHGDRSLAKADFLEAQKAWEEVGDKQGLVIIYNNLANNALDLGETREAASYIDKSVDLAEEIGYLQGWTYALATRALYLSEWRGDHDAAADVLHQAFRLAKETEDRHKVVWTYRNYALLYWRQGRVEEARESMEFFAAEIGDNISPIAEIANLLLMVRLCTLCHDADAARGHLQDMERISAKDPAKGIEGILMWGRGILHAYENTSEEADASFRRALELPLRIWPRAQLLLDYGQFLASIGEGDRADGILRQAYDASKASGRKPMQEAAEDALRSMA